MTSGASARRVTPTFGSPTICASDATACAETAAFGALAGVLPVPVVAGAVGAAAGSVAGAVGWSVAGAVDPFESVGVGESVGADESAAAPASVVVIVVGAVSVSTAYAVDAEKTPRPVVSPMSAMVVPTAQARRAAEVLRCTGSPVGQVRSGAGS